MFETNTTLVGRLITPFRSWTFGDGTVKISARMACTERRYNRAAGEWTDGQTLYMTIVCRRALAENAFVSLRAGDPLVVHGRLYSREYEKDGKPRTVTEMEASSLGPDLQWCTTVVTRRSRSAAAPGPSAAADAAPDLMAAGVMESAAHEPPDPARDAAGPDEAGDPVPSADPPITDLECPDAPWEAGGPAVGRVGEVAVGV